MIRTAVPEQHEIGDPMLAQELVKEDRPFREPAAEISDRIGPVAYVTAVEIDPVDSMAEFRESSPDAPEEWARRTLKKEEGPLRLLNRQWPA
jgi:hypothetical protein